MPLADMSGLVPPLAPEVVPSRMATTLLILNFEIILGPVGLGLLAAVRRRDGRSKAVVAHVCGR